MDKYQQSQKSKIFKPAHNDDPYLALRPSGAAVCPQCGVYYQDGNWTWKAQPPHAAQSVECPACRRIADNAPAGTVKLSGDFLHEHQEEILSLIKHTEAMEKADHALERLLNVHADDDGMEVTTTGMHLANRLGHALNAAYKGRSHYHYSDDETHVSIAWHRD